MTSKCQCRRHQDLKDPTTDAGDLWIGAKPSTMPADPGTLARLPVAIQECRQSVRTSASRPGYRDAEAKRFEFSASQWRGPRSRPGVVGFLARLGEGHNVRISAPPVAALPPGGFLAKSVVQMLKVIATKVLPIEMPKLKTGAARKQPAQVQPRSGLVQNIARWLSYIHAFR